MSAITESKPAATRIPVSVGVGIVIGVWGAYTVLNTVYPGDALAGLPAFIPGIVGIAALLAAGLTLEECYLRAAPISRRGITAFAALMIPGSNGLRRFRKMRQY